MLNDDEQTITTASKVIINVQQEMTTMKEFMDENFLLETETAKKLYHEHAAKMPIID